MRFSPRPAVVMTAAVLAFWPRPVARAADRPELAFEVTYTAECHPGPITARVYVMLGPEFGFSEPRFGPDWFDPQPFFAVDASDWRPGQPLRFGPDAIGYPGPLKTLKAGNYMAQAVVRLNLDAHSIGEGIGNAYGSPVLVRIDPDKGGMTKLEVDRLVRRRQFEETDRLKLVDIPSPMLSKFLHRPIRHRAAVRLPEGDLSVPRPTLYVVPGFGGDHYSAGSIFNRHRAAPGDMIRVVLNPDCGSGHHVFADSAANGPRGRALVEELIPYIERTFPAIAEPGARLLRGHSSGGWSTLWLQVTYPDVFGGTWSTSPDPVDFRDFQGINIYRPGENMFRDRQGKRRPIARIGQHAVLFYDDFSRMDDVIGEGGQLHSFEAVFSPLDPGGKPCRLWNRSTGDIDPKVAQAWEKYDIRLVLERNWDRLGPKLAGKIHVVTGEVDTFYLEGAVKLLKESLEALKSDAVIEIVPGRDHGNLVDTALAARFEREMREMTAKYRADRVPPVPDRCLSGGDAYPVIPVDP